MFLPTSRYHSLSTATHTCPAAGNSSSDVREVVYVRRRFLPRLGGDALEHTVTQGDRLDNIAARTLGDPELFWRICDANTTLHPSDLTETVGRALRIPFLMTTR